MQHVNINRSLAVGCGRKHLSLAGRNGRVPRNHRRRHTALRFDRQRQRGHIQQQQIFYLAAEHAALDRGAHCDYFIRVHSLVAFFSEELFDESLNARHASLSANQHDFIDLAGIHARIFHALLAWRHGALDEVFNHGSRVSPA